MKKNDDAAIRNEIQSHLDEHAAALVAAGVAPAAARRQAAVALGLRGGVDAAEEACRDVRPGRWRDDLVRDLSYGLRLWRRHPGFAAIVLFTLGLGIGATTLMVTLVNGVLLKPLAFAHPERVVSVQEQTAASPNATALAEGWGNIWAVTYPNYMDLAASSRTLELGAWTRAGDIISAPGAAGYVNADEVTASLFPVLGVQPVAGRDFTAQDDRSGAPAVAIISARLARQRFGSASEAPGKHLTFAGAIGTVVGVMPPGFDLNGYTTAEAADIYTPLGQDTSPALQNRGRHSLGVAARLRPGATLAQAQSEAGVVSQRLEAQYPQTNAQRSFLIQPWRADVGNTSTTLWLLLAAAGLVLLIACANVASLLLVRAVARAPELAMRAALGASRGRLVRQCLAESLLFGVGGGGLGLAIAAVGLHPFLAIWPGSLPRAADVAFDGRVFAAAAVLSLLCGFAFGLAPAWRVRLQSVEAALRGAARSVAGGSGRLHGSFVAAEVALAVVLLAGAGVLGRAMVRLSALDLGVNPANVLTGRVALPASVLASTPSTRAAWIGLLARVRALPGVESAATVDTVPLREGNNPDNYWIARNHIPDSQQPTALATSVSPDYFAVMGIPLLEGRVIDARDRMGAQPVAVIDEVLARHAFGNRNPIGQRINIGQDMGNQMLTIVGVVRHVQYWG
ncbi:MAG: ABC transporter permease, partial [Terriglobales bacterium]